MEKNIKALHPLPSLFSFINDDKHMNFNHVLQLPNCKIIWKEREKTKHSTCILSLHYKIYVICAFNSIQMDQIIKHGTCT